MKRCATLMICIIFVTATVQAQRGTRANRDNKTSQQTGRDNNNLQAPKKLKRFNCSIGMAILISNRKKSLEYDGLASADLTRSAMGAGLYIYPKFYLKSFKKCAISFGIPLSLAYSSDGSYTLPPSANDRKGVNVLYDLPLMLDLNGGYMAPGKRSAEGRIGYYFGLGVGMAGGKPSEYNSQPYTTYHFDFTRFNKVQSVGPTIQAGIVFKSGSGSHPLSPGIALAYKYGMNEDAFNFFCASFFVNW